MGRDGYKVFATTTPNKASHFYIIPTEDDEHHFEFYIAYRGGSGSAKEGNEGRFRERLDTSVNVDREQDDGQEVEELQYYLSAPVPAVHVMQSGPVAMKLNVVSEHARFTLRNRVYKRHRFLSRGRKNVDTAPWVAHRDTFYIRCARRGPGKKAFLAVIKESGAGTGTGTTHPTYKTILAPDINHHQESEECFMLFRLLPTSYKLCESDSVNDSEDGQHRVIIDEVYAGESEEVLPIEEPPIDM